jgi:hypothetical protein
MPLRPTCCGRIAQPLITELLAFRDRRLAWDCDFFHEAHRFYRNRQDNVNHPSCHVASPYIQGDIH